MPFWDRGKWRGVVKINGKRFTDSFATKREAISWENEFRKGAQATKKHFCFKEFSDQYLAYAQSKFSGHTYKEKISLSERFLGYLGANLQIDQILPCHIQGYLLDQAKTRSNNCANRDRKNLLAMWNWGLKILDLPVNPVAKIDRFPHDRKAQYVPPEQDILRLLAAADRKERAFLDCYLSVHRGEKVGDIQAQMGGCELSEAGASALDPQNKGWQHGRRMAAHDQPAL